MGKVIKGYGFYIVIALAVLLAFWISTVFLPSSAHGGDTAPIGGAPAPIWRRDAPRSLTAPFGNGSFGRGEAERARSAFAPCEGPTPKNAPFCAVKETSTAS